jgi:hypothetical protein
MAQDTDKKQILLRLSSDIYSGLTQLANDDFRSINGEIEYILHEYIQKRKTGKTKSADETQ